MRWNQALAKALIAQLLLGALTVCAQDIASVRIGFVLNFARYVEWPETILKPGMPIYICLAPGDADMTGRIGELSKQIVQNRPIQARQITRPTEIDNCEVLYLPAELPTPAAAWLNAAAKVGALTVSDGPDFFDMGGMIGLVLTNRRYRFDINLGNVSQSNLRISTYLLKLARTVK